MLRIANIVEESIVDGPGIRLTVFTQGCTHNCPGCHNPSTHDLNGGYDINISEILKKIDENPLLDGVTLSGGDPILQAEECIELAREVKNRGLNLWIYTGFLFEDIVSNKAIHELLQYTDVLVDGKFEIENRSLDLLFKGSSNQRVIDIQSSLKTGKICIY